MSIYKKIIAVFANVAIAFSFLAVLTYAGDFSGAGGSRSDFYAFVNFPGGGGSFCGGAGGSRADYDTYVSTLDNTIITSADTGFSPAFHWIGYEAGTLKTAFYPDSFDITSYQPGNPFSVVLKGMNMGTAYAISVYSDAFSVSSGSYYIDWYFTSGAPGSYVSSNFYLQIYQNGSWTSFPFTSRGSYPVVSHDGYTYKMASLTSTCHLDSSNLYRLVYSFTTDRDSSYTGVNILYTCSASVSPVNTTWPSESASTRPASLMQTINNYNTTNNTTNYYIGTTDANGSVNQIYDPNLFDEQTMVFTEPVSGIQYQCVGWKYYYDDRVYILELADNSMSYNGTNIKYLGLPGPDVR